MSVTVADASILIHLSRIGRFHLLKGIYRKIAITPSVFMEVVEKGWGLPGSLETESAARDGWIKVSHVVDKLSARELAVTRGIHSSNAETVQLARESNATTLLADEEEVRALAGEFRIKVTGCRLCLLGVGRTKKP